MSLLIESRHFYCSFHVFGIQNMFSTTPRIKDFFSGGLVDLQYPPPFDPPLVIMAGQGWSPKNEAEDLM